MARISMTASLLGSVRAKNLDTGRSFWLTPEGLGRKYNLTSKGNTDEH